MMRFAVLLALLPAQEGEVERLWKTFFQRRGEVRNPEQHDRLLTEVRQELERHLKEHPRAADAPRAAFHLAQTWLMANAFKEAVAKLRAVVKDYPDSDLVPDARFLAGQALFRAEDDAGAREAFLEFVQAHPKDERAVDARIYAAMTLQNEQKYDDAAASLLETRRDYRDSWAAMTQLALIQHLQGKNAEARRTLEEIVRDCKEGPFPDLARRHLAAYLTIGTDAPDFQANDLDGRPHTMAGHRGKVVILYFFDTRASREALAEAEFLRRAVEDFKGRDLQILGVSLNPKREELKLFTDIKKIDWPIFFDGKGFNGGIARLYDVRGLPSITIIDRAGRIRFYNLAGRDLRVTVGKLLEEK